MRKLITICSLLIITVTTTAWSADDIVINEIMYNSDGEDVEYVEIYNASTGAIDVTDWYILDENDLHTPCILSGILQAGEYLVIAGNVTLFQQKYPGVSNINTNDFDTGSNAWGLGNGGDAVRLFDNSNILHDIVEYDDGGAWPGSPDGNGPSLELLHPTLDNSLPTSWDPSSVNDGTPGIINSVFTDNVAPTCKDGERSIDLPTNSVAVLITAIAFDIEGLDRVELFVDTGNGFAPQLMNDEGQNGDAVAGDSTYSAIIPPQNSGTVVKYYALATDDIGTARYLAQ